DVRPPGARRRAAVSMLGTPAHRESPPVPRDPGPVAAPESRLDRPARGETGAPLDTQVGQQVASIPRAQHPRKPSAQVDAEPSCGPRSEEVFERDLAPRRRLVAVDPGAQ